MCNRKCSMLIHPVCLFTALMLVLGLVGGADNTNGVLPSENVDLSTEGEEVVITFSYNENAYATFKPLIEAFHEENPSITIQYVPLTDEDYNTPATMDDRLLMLARSADTTLTSIRSNAMGRYFLDLQPLIDSDSSFDSADFWAGSLSALEDTEGRVLGLPMTFFLQGIFYDKAAFDAANLPQPQPGWTWDDFRGATAALAQNQTGEARFGYVDRASASILQPLIGHHLALNDGEINAEILADELDWYVQMAREEQLLGLKSTDDHWNGLLRSEAPPAMWYGSLFEFILGGVMGEPEATELLARFAQSAYGFAPFPVAADGDNVNTTPVNALCGVISAGSEHPVEAWQWLNFLSQHWLVSDMSFVSNQLNIPARPSVADSAGFWDNFPDEAQEAMQYGLEHAWFSSLYPQAESAILDAVADASEGRTTDLRGALEEAETAQASWPQDIVPVPEITVATPQPYASTALDVVTIHFYHDSWESEEKAAITALVNQFNRDHKDEITVQADNVTEESYEEGFYVGMANTYDCFLSQLDPQGAGSSGVILDLTTLMEAEDAAFQQDFDPLLLDAARYQESLFALPLSNQPAIMAYNADLLADLGLEPPALDWTFDEFLELITAVTSSSGSEQIYGFVPESHLVSTTQMFYAGRGVQWRDTSGEFPVVMFNTPEMADAMAWVNELEQSGVLFQSASGNDWWPSITRAVSSGQIGFWTTDAGEQEKEYFDGSRPAFNIGIAPLPYTAKPNGAYDSSYATGFYISNLTENPQACWELAKYFSEELDVLTGIPARISVANSPAWEAQVGAENAEVYQAAVASNLTDVEVDPYGVFFWGPVKDWLFFAEQNIANGNDSAQALVIAQQYADAYLECMAPLDVTNFTRQEMSLTSQDCAKQVDPASP